MPRSGETAVRRGEKEKGAKQHAVMEFSIAQSIGPVCLQNVLGVLLIH